MALARKLGVREASDKLQVLTSTLANWVKLVTRPVACTRCSYTTYTASVMREHEKTSHSSGGKLPRDFHLQDYQLRPFPCQLCAARSKNKESLKKHMKRAHVEDIVKKEDDTQLKDLKEYDCRTCGKSFNRKKLMRDHMKAYHSSTLSNNASDKTSDKISDKTCDKTSDKTCDKTSNKTPV